MALGDKTGRTGISRCCGANAVEQYIKAPGFSAKGGATAFLCDQCGQECRVLLDTVHNQNNPMGNGASNGKQPVV